MSPDTADCGDLHDIATSPNDPLFFFHHNNLARSYTGWLISHEEMEPTGYGYPLYGFYVNQGDGGSLDFTFPNTSMGIGLIDKVSSNWGFTDKDLGISAHDDPDELWTHADALCWLGPKAAPYKYDYIPLDTPNPFAQGMP